MADKRRITTSCSLATSDEQQCLSPQALASCFLEQSTSQLLDWPAPVEGVDRSTDDAGGRDGAVRRCCGVLKPGRSAVWIGWWAFRCALNHSPLSPPISLLRLSDGSSTISLFHPAVAQSKLQDAKPTRSPTGLSSRSTRSHAPLPTLYTGIIAPAIVVQPSRPHTTPRLPAHHTAGGY